MAICGKHRGVVVDSQDPEKRGRLKVKVPDLLGESESWALPSLPFAGRSVGFLALPPVGANVWVEFEGCDTSSPIWSGCFWAAGEAPAQAATPQVKVFRTGTMTLALSEVPGEGFTIEASGTKLVLKPDVIEIRNGAQNIKITPALVSINNGALEVL